MVELSRIVRFSTNPASPASDAGGPVHNGFAGHPPMRGLGRFDQIEVVCRGEPDPVAGWLISIAHIDRAVRETVIPRIARTAAEAPLTEPGELLPDLLGALRGSVEPEIVRLRWRLTPTYSVEMKQNDMQTILLRQQFEFAASHRLHVENLSTEENQRLFGKCNNPAGHGHNYQLEPEVAVPLDDDGRQNLTLRELERITDKTVISRLDHKHLNTDVPEFADVNPSVENIAKVCYGLLAPAVAEAGRGVTLRRVTVSETEKTSCAYPAEVD